MFKRELKNNLKGFIIWLLILISFFLMVYLIYPSIIAADTFDRIDEITKIFPEEVLKAFNMDISELNSAFGWLKSEGFVFILIVVGSYAGVLGSNILLKEEDNKTIEYLHSLPTTRTEIVVKKVLVGLIYIISMILILAIFNFIGLKLSEEFDQKQFVLVSITPVFSSIVIFFVSMLISTFTKKTRKTFGISLGIVFISYILQVISSMTESVEFLKYFSIFTLADIRNVISNIEINPIIPILSLVLSLVLFVLILLRYNKKELV